MSKHALYPFFQPIYSEKGKRCYISGPMTGYPNENADEFNKAEKHMVALGYSVCNPIATSHWLGDLQHHEYLRFDFQRVLEADFLVALDGWEHSKGALAEILVATRIGLKVWRYSTFDNYDLVTYDDVAKAIGAEYSDVGN